MTIGIVGSCALVAIKNKTMKLIKLLFFIFWTYTIKSQVAIEVPKLLDVHTEDYIPHFVSISVDNSENIYIEKKEIKKDSFDYSLSEALKKRATNGTLNLYYTTIELIIDKDVKLSLVIDLLNRLRNLGLLKIFFVCNSEYYSRIEGIWSTGFKYRLNSDTSNRVPLWKSIGELIGQKPVGIIIGQENNPRIPPPPPPPPPREIDLEELKSNQLSIGYKSISVISDGKFIIDKDTLKNTEQLDSLIFDIMAEEPIAFIVNYDTMASLSYADFIYPLATTLIQKDKLMDIESRNRFNKAYNEVSRLEKSEIFSVYPFIFLIENLNK